MTTSSDEITMALDELETRLDRLRSLYEQYFTGIERSPPTVQHKDVERRVQLLRKMHIRSTSHRFRFQTLVQKYTTYLQYWQRIMRRIEEGTHRRDLARAARYGAKPKPQRSADNVYELDPDAIEDVSGDEFEADVDEAPTNERPALAPPVAARTPSVMQPTQPTNAVAKSAARQVEVLPFDVIETPAKTVAVPELTRPSSVPNVPTVQPKVEAPIAAPIAAPAASQTAKRPGLSVFGVAQKPGTQKPSGPTPSISAPAPVAQTPAAAGAPTTPMRALSPAAPTPSAATPTAPVATAARPAVAAPAATPAPAAVMRPNPASTPSAGASRPTSTDAALRELYDRYRSARQKNGEADVEFDTVAKQVRDTLPKLREKYPGQNVELDVSVKDGKTVLRPVVKAKK